MNFASNLLASSKKRKSRLQRFSWSRVVVVTSLLLLMASTPARSSTTSTPASTSSTNEKATPATPPVRRRSSASRTTGFVSRPARGRSNAAAASLASAATNQTAEGETMDAKDVNEVGHWTLEPGDLSPRPPMTGPMQKAAIEAAKHEASSEMLD